MTLGTDVSGWPFAEIINGVYYLVALGTSVSGWPTGLIGWICTEVSNSMYY